MNILKNPPSKNSPLHRAIWDLDRFSCWNYYASGTLPGRSWYKGVFRGYQLIPPFGYFSPSSRCAFRSLNILYFYNPQNYQNYLWMNKINKIVIWTSWWLLLSLQVCLLQAEVCLLQGSVISESGRGTSKLLKTSKIIKIGLEYKELQQSENHECFGHFRRYWLLKTRKKWYMRSIKIN